MLQLDITTDIFNELSDELKTLYTQTNDGYKLQVEIPSTIDNSLEGLKANNDKILGEKRALKEKLKAFEDEATQKQHQDLEAKGRYEELLTAKQNDFNQQLDNLKSAKIDAESRLNETILEAALTELTTMLSDTPDLLRPHIRARLRPGPDGIEILDKAGNLTTGTITSLKEEFENADEYLPLLKKRGSVGGGAQTPNNTSSPQELFFDPRSKDYSPSKQSQLQEKDPQQYKALTEKYNLDDVFTVFEQERRK